MIATTMLKTMRPPFLLLVLSCLSLPLCYSIAHHQSWSYPVLILIASSALLAHVSVNMLNEYMDCASNLDRHTTRTPFSGGSGALVEAPEHLDWIRRFALVMVALTVVSGLAIVLLQSQQVSLLTALGVTGIAIVIGYTPWINRHPWLCLITPGVGFGVVMSYGSYVALTGRTDLVVLVLSFIPLLLVNNLLLLNQFPDAQADEKHGRRHLVIAYGYRISARVLLGQWLLVAVTIISLVAVAIVPLWALWLLLFLLPAGWVYTQARDYQAPSSEFIRAMGLNVVITLLLPIVIAIILISTNK